MTINGKTPRPAAVAADGGEPFTPEQIVETLRTLRQHVPDFGPLTVPDAASLRRMAHVDDDFVQATINTVGASPYLAAALGRSADLFRAERTDVSRWSAVEDELRALLRGVAAANLVRRHRVGLTTLQAYGITRQLVRHPEHADLLPHMDAMRRLNKFGRKRRTPPAETPQP